MIKQEIKVTDISILDMKMFHQAINQLGALYKTLKETERLLAKQTEHILHYSICQSLLLTLTNKLNKPKVFELTQKEQTTPDKKMVLETFKAIILFHAIDTYSYTATDYEKARIDQIRQQIYKQLM